ncbi:hypothetical protein PR048_003175 [Dryococelus australis]|uniref:Uncharacterized protein n=1 Tax=Dryococelus australis TaxID=614101 RepID=A0ABQ9IMC1_9NEOP|nr:hypothetical protein PR048_003175 [Dryococelus australis]
MEQGARNAILDKGEHSSGVKTGNSLTVLSNEYIQMNNKNRTNQPYEKCNRTRMHACARCVYHRQQYTSVNAHVASDERSRQDESRRVLLAYSSKDTGCPGPYVPACTRSCMTRRRDMQPAPTHRPPCLRKLTGHCGDACQWESGNPSDLQAAQCAACSTARGSVRLHVMQLVVHAEFLVSVRPQMLWFELRQVVSEHLLQGEPLKRDPMDIEMSMEQRRNEVMRETGNHRENPPTSNIVQHDSHMRKSGSDPAGKRTRFVLVGGKQANRSASAAPYHTLQYHSTQTSETRYLSIYHIQHERNFRDRLTNRLEKVRCTDAALSYVGYEENHAEWTTYLILIFSSNGQSPTNFRIETNCTIATILLKTCRIMTFGTKIHSELEEETKLDFEKKNHKASTKTKYGYAVLTRDWYSPGVTTATLLDASHHVQAGADSMPRPLPPREEEQNSFPLVGSARNSEVLRGGEGMEQRRNERAGETGDSRENPLTSGIVRHDPHMRKSGRDPNGNRIRFAWVAKLVWEMLWKQECDRRTPTWTLEDLSVRSINALSAISRVHTLLVPCRSTLLNFSQWLGDPDGEKTETAGAGDPLKVGMTRNFRTDRQNNDFGVDEPHIYIVLLLKLFTVKCSLLKSISEKTSLPLPAYILTGTLIITRPVKLAKTERSSFPHLLGEGTPKTRQRGNERRYHNEEREFSGKYFITSQILKIVSAKVYRSLQKGVQRVITYDRGQSMLYRLMWRAKKNLKLVRILVYLVQDTQEQHEERTQTKKFRQYGTAIFNDSNCDHIAFKTCLQSSPSALMHSSLQSSGFTPSRPFTPQTPRPPSSRNLPPSSVLFTDIPRRIRLRLVTAFSQLASIKDCRPFSCGCIYSVVGDRTEISPNAVFRRGSRGRRGRDASQITSIVNHFWPPDDESASGSTTKVEAQEGGSSGEIWAGLNNEVLRADVGEARETVDPRENPRHRPERPRWESNRSLTRRNQRVDVIFWTKVSFHEGSTYENLEVFLEVVDDYKLLIVSLSQACSMRQLIDAATYSTDVDTRQDLVVCIQAVAGIIRDMPGIFPRSRNSVLGITPLSPIQLQLTRHATTFQRIAQRGGRELSAVDHWWCWWSNDGAHARQPGSGRHRHTDSRLDRQIRRASIADRTATAAQIRATVAAMVSTRTITNSLLDAGLRSRVPLARLTHTPHHRAARLGWCRERRNSRDECNSVELSLVMRADSALAPVTNVRDEQESSNNQKAIAYNDRTPLVFVEGTLNTYRYIQNIIQPILLPFLQRQGEVLFQQDNARAHTYRVTQRALEGVHQIPWPARSPDLSPIEHVWDMMGWRLVRKFDLGSVHVPPVAMFKIPSSALTHSRLHLSVSHPLVHSSHEHLTRRRPAISRCRPHFTSLVHTRQAASIKDCRPLGCGSIYSVLGCHLESSQTCVMSRGGLRRQPFPPEHSCIVAKLSPLLAFTGFLEGDTDSHECIVQGRGESEVGLRLRHGAAGSAPAAAPRGLHFTQDNGSKHTAHETRMRLMYNTRVEAVVKLLALHQDEPGSIPGRVTHGFSQVVIMQHDGAGQRVFSGLSRFSLYFVPALLHSRLISPSSAIKIPLLRGAQISPIEHLLDVMEQNIRKRQLSYKNDINANEFTSPRLAKRFRAEDEVSSYRYPTKETTTLHSQKLYHFHNADASAAENGEWRLMHAGVGEGTERGGRRASLDGSRARKRDGMTGISAVGGGGGEKGCRLSAECSYAAAVDAPRYAAADCTSRSRRAGKHSP